MKRELESHHETNGSTKTMDLYQYVNKIRFRLIHPESWMLPIGFDQTLQRLKLGVWFEMYNTCLPENNEEMKQRLQDVCYIPRMSTYAIGAIINKAVEFMKPGHAFVNIGVWRGFSFLSGMMGNEQKICIGIDNFSQFGGPKEHFLSEFCQYKSSNHQFHEMDYKDYLTNKHQDSIGVFIYDGDHSYENQRRALELAEPYFADDCVILVDDINFEAVKRANHDFIENSPNDYQVIFSQETFCNRHPTFWNGLTIFQRQRQT